MHISIMLEHAPYDGYSRVTTVSIWFIPCSVLMRSPTALCWGRHNPGSVTLW